MATVDELLAAETTESDDELSFLIDEHLRIITVPERGVVLGVEGDKDVNRVRFRMNRYYHGSDLSSFQIRINYQNAEGEVNYFTVTEKTVNTDTFSFIWVVAADAVIAKGTVAFVVNCFTADTSGVVQKAYHTTLGTASALEGLEVDVEGNQPQIVDFLSKLKNELTVHAGTVLQQMDTCARLAESFKTAARNYANAASNSASAAKASEEKANGSAQNAKASEEAAANSAAEAKAATGFDPNEYYSKTEADAKFGIHYTLPAATTAVLGGIKLSEDFTIDEDGTLHLAGGTAPEPYPVGCIYQSTDAASPAELYGGTWEQIASERVLMGASSTHAAGTTVKAGLPNITGSVGRFASAYSGYNAADRKQGALSYSGEGNMGYYSSSGSGGYGYYIDFNASRSNAIYGRSSTVQPAAYYVYIWHRVA